MPAYKKIARRFLLGGGLSMKEYVGDVVASKDALFLKPNARFLASMLGSAFGGVLGGLAVNAMSNPFASITANVGNK